VEIQSAFQIIGKTKKIEYLRITCKPVFNEIGSIIKLYLKKNNR